MKKLIFTLFLIFVILVAIILYLEAISLIDYDFRIRKLIIFNYTLPRIAVAFICGAFLAIATAIMAQITQNPLASDSTLGVGSGAGFFMLTTALFFPNLEPNSVFSSFFGAIMALGILFILSLKQGFSVFTTTLSGLIIGLFFSSLTTLLLLFFQEESYFVTVWMSGDMAQDGVMDFYLMLIYSAPALILIFYFSSSFHLFILGDSACKALGVNIEQTRIIGLLLAAYLTAITVAFVGIISFIGLGAYTIVDRFKFSNFTSKLVYCGLFGGLLLGITDEILMIVLKISNINLPAGGISAFLGTPLLVWLIFWGIKNGESGIKTKATRKVRKTSKTYLLIILFIALVFVCIFSLFYDSQNFQTEILNVRISRIVAALTSGIMLGLIGVVLQSLSHNPMASPELLGINSGVSLGVLIAMFTAPFLTIPLGVSGAFLMLAFMITLNYKNGMLPQKVILTGIAIMAFTGSVEKILLTWGDSRIYNFINYASGSTYSVTSTWALFMVVVAIFSTIVGLIYSKELDILSLGDISASSLGLNLFKYRGILFLFCAGVSSIASLSIGPISFIGLLAPHIASFLGYHKASLKILSALLIGAILMVVSDFLGRTLISPYEIPSGLVSTIIGSLYFVFMIRNFR